VLNYRAGDLERRYPKLALEEDFFVNYGYLPRAHHRLMHPRTPATAWSTERDAQAAAVLAYVRERGSAHPREVDARFAHGKVTNWFGGSSNATTQLLDAMHYRGLLRVVRREGGTRVYAAREAAGDDPGAAPASATADRCMDALVDLAVQNYAPLPAATLAQLVNHLRGGAPQWAAQRKDALARAKRRLAHARVDGIDWYWPPAEKPTSARWRPDPQVRLLTPFDPVVWDRRRFATFWGWAYRFEAYTPAAKRKLGYYALPLLWRESVIGWGNVTSSAAGLRSTFGYHTGRAPRDAAFRDGLEAELERMRRFLDVAADAGVASAGCAPRRPRSPGSAAAPRDRRLAQ
jgi:uncharacterized protein YcaQ